MNSGDETEESEGPGDFYDAVNSVSDGEENHIIETELIIHNMAKM